MPHGIRAKESRPPKRSQRLGLLILLLWALGHLGTFAHRVAHLEAFRYSEAAERLCAHVQGSEHRHLSAPSSDREKCELCLLISELNPLTDVPATLTALPYVEFSHPSLTLTPGQSAPAVARKGRAPPIGLV